MLLLSFAIAFISCSHEYEAMPEEIKAEVEAEKTDEEVTHPVDTPVYINLQQTDDGYAPVVEPISAETFNSFFSVGGWSIGYDSHVSPEGVVSEPWVWDGAHSTILKFVPESSLNLIYFSLCGDGKLRSSYKTIPYSYDEQTNILTYDDNGHITCFTVLSINEKEIRCTKPLDDFDYWLMSYDDVEQYVLKYYTFKPISNSDIQTILSYGID